MALVKPVNNSAPASLCSLSGAVRGCRRRDLKYARATTEPFGRLLSKSDNNRVRE